jgi:succinyl-diaminopimelate desuccinylase
MTDLLALTADLVDIPSVSHDERALADRIEADLREVPGLAVERVGDNVVARTQLGRPVRLVLAGHTDTVPPNGNDRARVDGDTLWGVGSTDMKGGLAVMLELARDVREPAVDVTWVFYTGEEVAAVHNGLGHLFRDRPDLLAGDVALLGEPTAGGLEAGCQGTLRLEVTLAGARAHTARPWMGRNAIHRLGELLRIVAAYEERRPVIDGIEYREALQAVRVDGGVAANVVPDAASVTLNHRFAPDRSINDAEASVRALLSPVLEDGDHVARVDAAPAAGPALAHPLIATLVERNALPVVAKLGWTDGARFAEHGIPAANFGPGDPTIAHTAGEFVTRDSVELAYRALRDLIERGL